MGRKAASFALSKWFVFSGLQLVFIVILILHSSGPMCLQTSTLDTFIYFVLFADFGDLFDDDDVA